MFPDEIVGQTADSTFAIGICFPAWGICSRWLIRICLVNKTASEPQVHGAGFLLSWVITVLLICHWPGSSDQEYVIVCSFSLYLRIKWPCKDSGFFCGPSICFINYIHWTQLHNRHGSEHQVRYWIWSLIRLNSETLNSEKLPGVSQESDSQCSFCFCRRTLSRVSSAILSRTQGKYVCFLGWINSSMCFETVQRQQGLQVPEGTLQRA